MAKRTNQLSRGGPGGGMGSRVVKQVSPRPGHVAQRIHPGGVSQLGQAVGNHITDGRRSATNYRGDRMVVGELSRPGQPRLGNEVAFTTQAGAGGSRTVSRCGSQQGVSPSTPIGPTKDTLAGR
jgi:hypothetical protein